MRYRLFALIAVALGPTVTLAAPATDETAAHRDCAADARIEHRINVGTGVNNAQAVAASPLTLTIATGSDRTRYADCLRREGFDPRERMVATFDRASACRDHARRSPGVRLVAGSTQLGNGFDDTAYRDCLGGEVDAEVIGIGSRDVRGDR